jgi:hypothetical protein
LLVCATVDPSELDLPQLAPGELVLGPVYFGFRLRQVPG